MPSTILLTMTTEEALSLSRSLDRAISDLGCSGCTRSINVADKYLVDRSIAEVAANANAKDEIAAFVAAVKEAQDNPAPPPPAKEPSLSDPQPK